MQIPKYEFDALLREVLNTRRAVKDIEDSGCDPAKRSPVPPKPGQTVCGADGRMLGLVCRVIQCRDLCLVDARGKAAMVEFYVTLAPWDKKRPIARLAAWVARGRVVKTVTIKPAWILSSEFSIENYDPFLNADPVVGWDCNLDLTRKYRPKKLFNGPLGSHKP